MLFYEVTIIQGRDKTIKKEDLCGEDKGENQVLPQKRTCVLCSRLGQP